MRSFRKVVWQAVCLGLVAFVTPPVQAFMPDGPKMPAGISVQATQAVHRAVSTVALKGRQQAAAARPDLAVRWDEHHGIPSTVSGLDLMGGSQGRGVGVTGAAIASGAAGEVQLKQQAVSVMGKLGGLYGIQDAGQEFAPHSVATSESGYRHVRLNQAYKGLPVFGGQVIVHFDGKGTARTVNGAYQPIGNLDVVATLTGEQAVDAAMADQKAMGKFPGTVTAGPELVIFAYGGVEPSLAYQVTVSYKNGTDMGRWRYWINAATGAILLRYNDIPSISAPSSGGSATITGSILTQEGGGTATIAGWREVTTNFFLWSFANTWYVYNVAINDYAYRGTNDWGTSDRMEMSAANNLQAVEDYYRVRHGRNSINDAGLMARANVHNTGQQNAFWNGSSIELYDELPCALDVMGHELTHGVDQYSADLIYADESGALNESMSDIFGTCVEFYYQPDGRASYPNSIPGHSDWLMGEDTAPEVGVIRDMKNPKAKGQPSKYKGINWDFNNEVHQNDSVQNFFFYLLCDGGSGTNEDIIYYLPGIGIRAAEKVAYLALTSYMIPSTDYTMARDYWLAAAQETDAAGATTNAAFFVNVAWAAVGIGTFNFVSPEGRYGAGGPVGTGPYLPASKVYTLRNPDTKDLTWSVFGTGTPWLDISSSTVTAAVGDVGLVTLSINQAAATNLAPGVYRDVVTFTNRITLLTTTRQVILHIAKNYTMTSVDYDWIDPVAGAHDYVGPSVSVNTPFPLPFQIGFYDDIYSALYISPHGLMGFLPDGLGSSLNEDLLTDVAPFGMLCPLWDAIEGNQYPAMMYYKVLGDAPHRKLVVTWDAAFHSADPTAQFSVQAIIEEAAGNSNNDIIFQYKDVAEGNDTYGSGQSATIGIEDEYGALCNKYSYNGEKWLANHMALKFTQNPQPDIQPPVGTIQSLGGSDQSAVFEIKFNESVTGLDTNDLVVTSNIPGIALGGIRGGGMRFLVSVTNIIGLGQVSMSVRGNAVADWAGNSNAPFGTAIYVVQPLGLDFADDMENGPAVWTASTQVFDKISTKSWEWVNPVTVGGPAANSGDHCWGAILGGNPSLNAWVMSAPISVRT
ncbi:MAG: M4 family metallopeptidase, partial [bacterium]